MADVETYRDMTLNFRSWKGNRRWWVYSPNSDLGLLTVAHSREEAVRFIDGWIERYGNAW